MKRLIVLIMAITVLLSTSAFAAVKSHIVCKFILGHDRPQATALSASTLMAWAS